MGPVRAIAGKLAPVGRINKDNFHIATKAEFRLIAQPDKAPVQWVKLVKMYGLNFNSESGSKYVTDGVRLWRYSDHWGRVRSCNWMISPAPKMVTGPALSAAWEEAMKTGLLTGGYASLGPDPVAVIGTVLFAQMKANT